MSEHRETPETVESPFPSDKSSILERHIHTILVSLILASILWVGKNVTETSQSIVELKGNMQVFQTNLEYVKGTLERYQTNRYTSSDAEKDLRAIDFRLKAFENRLNSVENEVRIKDKRRGEQ